MAADGVTPLATTAQMQEGPYADLVANYSAQALTDLMVQATREVESRCDRRLAPFTLTESSRATDTDVEDAVSAGLPLPQSAEMGMDYAKALGSSSLVRHLWLREFPIRYPDLWTGSVSRLQVAWPYGTAPFDIAISTVQFEADTGHVRYLIGTFVPPGSTVLATYTGGYTTVPADLVRLTMMVAAQLAANELNPVVSAPENLDRLIEDRLCHWRRM